MNERTAHRAAVEAGYADLGSYVAKYRDEPEYPGVAIYTVRMIWPRTGERGDVRIMDYGSAAKKRYRVACFCPGVVEATPGDTPKIVPEADNWCERLDDALAWFGLYVDRERRDGWEHVDDPKAPTFDRATLQARDRTRPSLHGDGHVGPVVKLARELDDKKVLDRARAVVSRPTPHYSYVDIGDVLVSYLRGEQDAQSALRTLDGLAQAYESARRRA